MCELLNLFVDGEITTEDEVTAMLFAETSSAGEPTALRRSIAATATRLLPPERAAKIRELLKEND
jgi:hypothetical protein